MENLDNLFSSNIRKCNACNGKGYIIIFTEDRHILKLICQVCKGKGWILFKEVDDWAIYDDHGNMDMFFGFK